MWSERKKTKLIRLLDGTRTLVQVAQKMGLPEPLIRAHYHVLKRNNYPVSFKRRSKIAPQWRPYEKRNLEIARLHRRGISVPRLAEQYGISRPRLYQILRKPIHTKDHMKED